MTRSWRLPRRHLLLPRPRSSSICSLLFPRPRPRQQHRPGGPFPGTRKRTALLPRVGRVTLAACPRTPAVDRVTLVVDRVTLVVRQAIPVLLQAIPAALRGTLHRRRRRIPLVSDVWTFTWPLRLKLMLRPCSRVFGLSHWRSDMTVVYVAAAGASAPHGIPHGVPHGVPTGTPVGAPTRMGEWSCPHCTFLNTKPEAPACEMCGGAR